MWGTAALVNIILKTAIMTTTMMMITALVAGS
jgi:hypothetical protein